jgi:hypothetical protein
MKNFFLISLTIFLIISCAALFNGAVFPNQCQKCVVIDKNSGQILQVFEGCGSENVRLEEQAKEAAFDYIKSMNNCNIDVNCETWKKDPEE